MSFSLKVVAGPGTSACCLVLADRPMVVGRLESNDCVVANDAAISRKHFEISIQNGQCWIKDLDSRNGTFLNNQAIQSSEVKTGDLIRAGGTQLEIFRSEIDSSAIPTSAKHLVGRSKIAITDGESTAYFSTRKFHSGKIASKRITEERFVRSFLDLPGAAVLISGKIAQGLYDRFPDAVDVSDNACLIFPRDEKCFQKALDHRFNASSTMFLNHTSARTKFVAHVTDFIDKFGSSKTFLAEYQELPIELANTLLNGIDLAICEIEGTDAAAAIFEYHHAKWLGSVIAADKS